MSVLQAGTDGMGAGARPRRAAGFTVAEVLFGSFVLLFGLTVILGIIFAAINVGRKAEAQEVGTAIARVCLEHDRMFNDAAPVATPTRVLSHIGGWSVAAFPINVGAYDNYYLTKAVDTPDPGSVTPPMSTAAQNDMRLVTYKIYNTDPSGTLVEPVVVMSTYVSFQAAASGAFKGYHDLAFDWNQL